MMPKSPANNMIEWKEAKGAFASGDDGFWGKWRVFNVAWNGSMTKGETRPKYVLHCYLPGIKNAFLWLEQDEAKDKAEGIMKYWLSGGAR
ncbi:hypothetical protein LCGC14_2695350 [marine sediment metagenome]|uniref:Uncharacterized protein n=1 Tax=marine sediment metagenome TaxID=412755 RepID=A0A0F8ZHD7_9ZZZZ